MKGTSQLGIAEQIKNKIEKAFCKDTNSANRPKTGENVLRKSDNNTTRLCINTIHNICLLSLALLLLTATATAVPLNISIQGRLTNDSNVVVTGNYDFNFRIYDAATAGNIVWAENHSSQGVIRGLFNIVAGDINTATTLNEIDFNTNKWLDITVNNETQTPRIKLTPTTAAQLAQKANSLTSSSGDTNFSSIGVSNYSFLNKVNATGDSNFTNINFSGNSFLNALFATGDSNFTNIGFSGFIFGDGSKLTGITSTDTNFQTFSDFNSWYWGKFDLNGSFYGKQDINAGWYGKIDINAGFVPYIGATKDVNLGAYNIKAVDINGYGIITGDKFKSMDANSVYGTNGVALGSGTTAFGAQSTALGLNTKATGAQSTALGSGTTASGPQSVAMGLTATASGDYSLAFTGGIASGTGSIATGSGSVASNVYSVSLGSGGLASGNVSIAIGGYTNAAGLGSFAGGYGCYDPVCGFTYKLFSTGTGSVALGYSDVNMWATGIGSTALGYNTKSSGIGSLAAGYNSVASGRYSTALDYNSEAIGAQSIAMGYKSMALGEGSVAIGYNVINNDVNSVAVGKDFNVAGVTRMHDDLNVSMSVNRGVSIQADVNRICFPSNSCEMYIDYNGTAFVFGSG